MHKPHMEWSIFLLFIGLLGIGLFTLWSYGRNYGEIFYYKKQLLWMLMGLGVFFVCYYTDYKKWEKYSTGMYLLGIGILILTELFGTEVNGARRWLNIGPLQIRSATLAVPLLLVIRCFKVAYRLKDSYGRLVLLALSSFLAIRFIMSMGINLGIFPIIECQMPFISYGGSALLADMAIMGLFLGIYRRKDISPLELVGEVC